MRQISVLTDVTLITCIVQRGEAEKIINAAREAGAQGATVNFARGTGIRERLGILGVAVEVEKEIINIVVSRMCWTGFLGMRETAMQPVQEVRGENISWN